MAPGDISFGLARMYSAYCDTAPVEFMVFRELEEALSALDLADASREEITREVEALPED